VQNLPKTVPNLDQKYTKSAHKNALNTNQQILLDNATSAFEFEDTQLDSSNAILSDLHLHSSGNHLIAATPYKVSVEFTRFEQL